jgi:hypothetical protein
MRQYSLFLPVFKQGDDFASHVEANNGHPVKSFLDFAERYKSAAEICQTLANRLSNLVNIDDIEVSGDTHSIWLNLPEEIANPLVKESILVEEDFTEDEG